LKANLVVAFGAVLGLMLFPAAVAQQSSISQAEILYLLGFVEHSGCQFYRNGSWYSSTKAQEHLRDKYNYLAARDRINTAEDFIEKVAGTSSLTGQPYRVRCADGIVARCDQWLRNELTRYRIGAPDAHSNTVSRYGLHARRSHLRGISPFIAEKNR
jgi:hypothetical protein